MMSAANELASQQAAQPGGHGGLEGFIAHSFTAPLSGAVLGGVEAGRETERTGEDYV
jgi:hypothetical protein